MQISSYNVKDPKGLKWNTVYIALVICIVTVSKIVSTFVAIPYNIVLMEGILAWLLVVNNNKTVKICRTFLAILAVVFVAFLYSFVSVGSEGITTERFLKFVMYGFLPCFCLQYPFHPEKLRRYILNIGCLHMLWLYLYAVPHLSSGQISLNATMDYSYLTLVYVFVAAFVLWAKEKLVYRLIAAVILLLGMYFLLFVSVNRGALVALAAFVLLFYITEKKGTIKKTIAIIAIAIMVSYAIVNLIPLLEWLYDITSENGIVIAPLRKMIQQLTYSDSATSGREQLYEQAWEMIVCNIGLPAGIGSYYQATGTEYPHNILLETGVELGILAALFVAYLIVRAFKYLIRNESSSMKQLVLFMLCLSMPRLMVSSTLWENSYFWMLILMVFEPAKFHLNSRVPTMKNENRDRG